MRWDILLAVAFLSTRVKEPDVDDSKKLDRLLRYLNATKDLHLTLQFQKDMQITGSIDVSFSTHGDMKSHTGETEVIGRGSPTCTTWGYR